VESNVQSACRLFTVLDQGTGPSKEMEMKFVEAVMQTSVMKLCHQILCQGVKDFKFLNINEFSLKVHEIWFSRSNRGARSAFQHIFAGMLIFNFVFEIILRNLYFEAKKANLFTM